MAELYSNLGLAPIGERDILMADFGPTNRFNQGPNADGIVWIAILYLDAAGIHFHK